MAPNANHNPVLQRLRTLENRYEKINENQKDFLNRQASGDNPDPNEFMDLLQKQSLTKTAMTAQFSLLQRPLKTVITDSR